MSNALAARLLVIELELQQTQRLCPPKTTDHDRVQQLHATIGRVREAATEIGPELVDRCWDPGEIYGARTPTPDAMYRHRLNRTPMNQLSTRQQLDALRAAHEAGKVRAREIVRKALERLGIADPAGDDRSGGVA
jgi:hypothetical protein